MSTSPHESLPIPYLQLREELLDRGFQVKEPADRSKYTRFTVEGVTFYLSNILGADERLPVQARRFTHVGVACNPEWMGLAALEAMGIGDVRDRSGSNFRDFPATAKPGIFSSRLFELRSMREFRQLLSGIEKLIRGDAAPDNGGVPDDQAEPTIGVTADPETQAMVEEPDDGGRPAADQGYEQDAEIRKVIDEHAMRSAIEHYRAIGRVVRVGKPYDLDCFAGDEHFRVEVKGTKTSGEAVLVTKNEIEHARACNPRVELFILSGISLAGSRGSYMASGGSKRIIREWIPEDEHLEALQFRYRIPPEASF